MPDAYLNTASTNFDKSVVPYVLKSLQMQLRGGLGYLPAGSVLNAPYVGGGYNTTFRAFAVADLPGGGDVSAEDGQVDADIEDLDEDYITLRAPRGSAVSVTRPTLTSVRPSPFDRSRATGWLALSPKSSTTSPVQRTARLPLNSVARVPSLRGRQEGRFDAACARRQASCQRSVRTGSGQPDFA